MAAERTVVVRIKAEYRAFEASMKAAARAAEQASEKIDKSGKKSSSALGQLLLDAKQHEQSWEIAGGAMLGFGAAVVGMVGVSIAKYAAFDKAMSRVKAATHASTTEMNQLREAAMAAGADTAFSAEEAAAGIEELAKAGVSTKDILSGGLAGALSLAAAGELAVGEAAEIAASALTQFKLSGDQIPHLADLLAAGAGKAQGSVQDMGAALNQSGLVAASTGLTIEETTGALAAFASAGLTGSDAGTSFKTMLQSLNPNSDKAAAVMEELGISAYDAGGEFIGMSEYAGKLQGALQDMSAEQRNATLKTLFGSDAVRAANVLYEQGAAGIQKWEDAVNAAGYAAQTAMIMQDNLAGDVEKLGGAFDTVFIKAGGGANDALRGLVQTGEDFVDTIGKIPGPALATVGSIAGIVGVTALAAGAFMTLAPKAIETWGAFRSLGTEGSKIPGTMGKIAKGAGIAAVALAGLQIIGELITTNHVKTTTDYAEAVMKVSQAGKKAAGSDLDSLFTGFDTVAGGKRAGEIQDLAGAVGELANPSFSDGLNQNLNFMNGWFNLPADKLTLVEGRLGDLGATLGDLAKAGDIESTAKTFSLISDEFERNGKTAKDALDTMPEYKAALQEIAMQSGVTASDGELLVWAMDGIAPAGVAAAHGAEAAAEGLASMGVSAEGTVSELDKLVEAMFAMSDGTLNVRSATRGFQEAIDGINESIKENGKSLDETTPKGRANAAALDAVAQGGKDIASAMASAKDANGNFVHTQEEVQTSLKGTYDATYAAARAFGLGKTESAALARELLGIPKDVSVDTWIADTAKNGADATRDAVNGIPDMKGVTVIVTDKGSVSVTAAQIQSIKDRTVSTQVTDDGTILTVQGGINNIKGTTEQIIVSDDGTVQVVQQRINKTTGKTEYIRVSDGGTVSGVQGLINSITGKTVEVHTRYTSSGDRPAARGPGGSGGPTASGFRGMRIPKHSNGARMPYTGLGTDKILGINSDGIPSAWVDDGEWVINERASNKHHSLLKAINSGDPRVDRMKELGGFANGGKVGAAEKRVKSTKRSYDRISGDKANRLRKLAAKDQWEAAKDELAAVKKSSKASSDSAKKSAEARKKAAEDEAARQGRLSDSRRELRTDIRRGNIVDSFTGGSGLSEIDKLGEVSRNKDYSKGQRKNAARDASSLERALKSLTSRSEKLKTALEAATDQADKLQSVSDAVSGGLRDEFSLGGTLGNLKSGDQKGSLSAGSFVKSAQGKAAQIKRFGGLLDKLRKKGYSSSIVQEVAELGSVEGTQVGTALLGATGTEKNALNNAYKSMDYWAGEAGQSVTESMYKGGLDAADGLVKGLESKSKKVDSAFYKLGKDAEKAFRRSLDMHSPSRTLAIAGSDALDGVVVGVDGNRHKLESAMHGLGKAGEAAFDMQPTYSVPPSAEVARYSAQPVGASGRNFTDGDIAALAHAMENVQVQASLRIGNSDIAQANVAGRKELRLPATSPRG